MFILLAVFHFKKMHMLWM